MDHLDFPLDSKAVAEDGQIEGIVAAYGNVDAGGDLIMPGAFTKSLKGRKTLPMLLFHDQQRPIGVWNEWEDSAKGLTLRGKIVTATAAGAEALTLAREGALAGLSIGYRSVKAKFVGAVRELSEIALHEGSLVAIPMNDRALITRVKDILDGGKLPTVREFEEHLRDAGFSKALATAIAAKATPHLRGEPEAKADDALEFLKALRA